MDRLSRAQILAAFEALAREPHASTLPAERPRRNPGDLAALAARPEIFVVGGAALVVLYDARPVTKDVDAVLTGAVPAADVRAAAARAAIELGLPDDWLNDGAKGFVPGLAPGAVLVSTPTSETLGSFCRRLRVIASTSGRWYDVGMALAAGVAEMLAGRPGQSPPSWTREVHGSPQRLYLVREASRMPRLRRLCQEQGPEPLRRRGLLAPSEFLTIA